MNQQTNMCGLIYIQRYDGKTAHKMIAKRYDHQALRGSEGYGFIALKDNVIKAIEREENEKAILLTLSKQDSPTILFHHRMPTSTPNVIESTHPIKVSHESLKYDYYVIHNGIVVNDEALKVEHEAKGFKYTTQMIEQIVTSGNIYTTKAYFNDSEALAIEFALSLESGSNKLAIEGSAAFIALQVAKGGNEAVALYYGRNIGNPLLLEENKDFFALASEGQGKLINEDTLYRFEYATGITTSQLYEIGFYKAYAGFNDPAYADSYDIDDRDFIDVPRTMTLDKGHKISRDEFEYEQYYETLLDEETDLKEWIADAKQSGDTEREVYLLEELTALSKQIRDIEQKIYANEAVS